MESETLRSLAEIAGIGGIALGVFLFLFRDVIRTRMLGRMDGEQSFRLLRLVTVLTWSVAVLGVGAWAWSEWSKARPVASTTPPSVTAVGGVAAGKDVKAKDISIEPPKETPGPGQASVPNGADGVTAIGGVAAGKDVNVDTMSIGDDPVEPDKGGD